MTPPEAIPQQILRIIDANLNRASEGLRVLEDIARFVLSDVTLTQQLKTMRHELVTGDWPFNKKLIQARDAESDVGVNIPAPGQEEKKELPIIVVANARRVQESLRTIEELSKTPDAIPELESEKFKQSRFNLYSIERDLLSKLLRQDKAKHISGLHAIIDTETLRGRSHIEVASQIIGGGARAIQLRDKITSKKELIPIAQELEAICAEQNVLFIVNDYLDLALATNADGLHLGQNDLPLKVARKLLPIDKILGCSTHSVEQAIAAESEGADYIAIGSMYPTPSKEKAIIVGLKTLQQVRQSVSLPIVAIGGINRDNAAQVMAAGADSVAVISAILGAESPEKAARQIVSGIEMQDEETDR
jgi:thiamine-phosphate pyrophosphorylase